MFKFLIASAIAYLGVAGWTADLCPHDKQVVCETDVQKAYKACYEAAKEKGQDQEADISCIKYFSTMEHECWPCVCQIAKNEGWTIRGCDTLLRVEEILKD